MSESISRITAGNLKHFNPALNESVAETYAAALTACLSLADLGTSALRLCHFMAQIAHETNSFRGLTESLRYSAARLRVVFPKTITSDALATQLVKEGPVAIANCVYAHKVGNGSIASGDSWRYRGRGFIQITGRANYAAFAKLTGTDALEDPDLLGDSLPAARGSALYWKGKHINVAADRNDIRGVTLLINPALQGLDQRKIQFDKAREIWDD